MPKALRCKGVLTSDKRIAMQHDLTKLRHALQNPADGPYALERMRNLLLEALHDWPVEKYHTADYLLPWGRPIAKRSRRTIEGLLSIVEDPGVKLGSSILKLTKMCELLNG
ncbi:hypothetical protein [Pseudomonas atacamensis]|jgi:hypothetical protein|uniref:Uncharacterized protein n=1 Tax=Pseudomonas iranensis TaxID=2745503 RepID=A0AAU7F457_9PSED